MAAVVAELYSYPLKSGRGLSRGQVRLDRFGVHQDRRWMLVDENGVFVSQRKNPRLALVDVLPLEQAIRFSVAGEFVPETLEVPEPDGDSGYLNAQVWSDRCEVLDAGDRAAVWFSDYLSKPVRLVFMPDSTFRKVDPDYAENGETVSFADGFPLLLTTQGSLDDLNDRLDTPVDSLRFRPNVVVAGTLPFAEDSWREIRIGSVAFRVAKPCERCVMTTIDHTTGKAGREPLATLARYRRSANKVLFGQNLIHRTEGVIRVADPVEILA